MAGRVPSISASGRTPLGAPSGRDAEYAGDVLVKEFTSENYEAADPLQRAKLRWEYLVDELPNYTLSPAGSVPIPRPKAPLQEAELSSSILLPVLLLGGVAAAGYWWNSKRKRR